MSAKPTMTEPEARDYIAACERLARMKRELDSLTGPPNTTDLLKGIDLALDKNAARLEEVFVGVMRGLERQNPHAEWSDARLADVGASVVRGVLAGLGDAAVTVIVLPLLRDQLRKSLSRVKYVGHDAPSMSDRRKRALQLKDEIAQHKRTMVPPQNPADWQLVEEIAGAAKVEIVRYISRAA